MADQVDIHVRGVMYWGHFPRDVLGVVAPSRQRIWPTSPESVRTFSLWACFWQTTDFKLHKTVPEKRTNAHS